MEHIIEVNGKMYTLQHPGNRAWVRLQSQLLDVKTKTLDMEKFFDYCFEHIVFPESGEKLNLDTIDLDEFEGVWSRILLPFCGGKLEARSVFNTKGADQETTDKDL